MAPKAKQSPKFTKERVSTSYADQGPPQTRPSPGKIEKEHAMKFVNTSRESLRKFDRHVREHRENDRKY